MKISNFDAAKVIHEVGRITSGFTGPDALPDWENLTPEQRDDRTREIHLFLESGQVPESVIDAELFTTIVKALR